MPGDATLDLYDVKVDALDGISFLLDSHILVKYIPAQISNMK